MNSEPGPIEYHAGDLHLVDNSKPCHFCPCDSIRGAKVPLAFSFCVCPCHWQNVFGLEQKLEAVKHFFGDRLK
jgi:Golgi nucleoside diphosphatase